MALFLLGALVTEIVGSIGGTTFKRQNSSRVMMKKSNGASRAGLLQNPRLVQNSYIFKKWRNLSGAEKTAWNSIASTNKVLNKFGAAVNVSGVAFQRRSDLHVNFLGFIPDPFSWNSNINTFSFNGVPEIDWTNSTFEVAFNLPEGNTFIALALEYSIGPLDENSYNFRRVYFSQEFEDGITVDMFDEMFSTYEINDSAYVLRLYAYAFTPSGVVSPIIREKVFSLG
jgi:hypothetical protein